MTITGVNESSKKFSFPKAMTEEPPFTPSLQRYSKYLVPVLLIIHAGLLAWGAQVHSPTLNEPGHLVAGISNWQFARFDIYRVNPPLVRMVAAAPVLLSGVKTDWTNYSKKLGERCEEALGADLVAANGERSFRLFTLARWMCIPFSLIGGYFCLRWGRELYGPSGGLLTLTLWCFCPNIIAHGQLITPDIAASSLGLAATYSFWSWLQNPNWKRAFVSGLVLGIAELAKTTLIMLVPLWCLMWPAYRYSDRQRLQPRGWLRELSMLALSLLVCLYVINLGYGFEGTGKPLGSFRFLSAVLGAPPENEWKNLKGGNRFADSWLGKLPVPLPENYLLGIDLQKLCLDKYGPPSYLRGQFSKHGWWYFYLYALLIKVPIGTWILIVLALTARFWGNVLAARRDEFIIWFPAVAILIFVSSQSRSVEHLRYVLPVFPFVFVWIGRLTITVSRRPRFLTAATLAALTWSVLSSLSVYPHSLSYFNEFVGGPRWGPDHLISSNADWGQDVLKLKTWLSEHPDAWPLNLAFFGSFDPRHAGIEYVSPNLQAIVSSAKEPTTFIPSGWYAISISYLKGLPGFIYTEDGKHERLPMNALILFQKLKPTAVVGYSIYIYDINRSPGPPNSRNTSQ